jgi:hypothetical protein
MPKSVSIVGIDAQELRWLRMLLHLLRHPEPGIPELARQALLYLTEAARQRPQPGDEPLDHAG